MKRIAIALVAAGVLALTGCARQVTVQKTEPVMGTDVTITVVAPSEKEGEAAIDSAMDEIKRLDSMMSLYKDDSQITRVNLAAGEHSVTVSPEMIEVVEEARRVSELSGGAFDVTIGPLVILWQMRLKEGTVPSEKEIRAVLPRVNYKDILIDKKGPTIFLTKKGMIMDLGGCAKGYAADRAAEVLKKQGIMNALVAVAGDIRAMGKREDGKPWRIGVQHPREAGRLLTTLDLSDKSISTSGDYERFKIIKEKRYHHIIDPRTGRPSEGTVSVTVIGDRGAIVDPLTTALFILGPEKGMKIVKELGYEAIFEDDRGNIVSTKRIKIAR
jgi:thiamine biosynthesis lipoprotein